MIEAERTDLKRLAGDKAFLGFLYRLIRSAGLFSIAPISPDSRSLEFHEGRRSLALDVLRELESIQDAKSPDGLPVLSSIQILVSVAQSAVKEKPLGGRSDPYSDLGDDPGE